MDNSDPVRHVSRVAARVREYAAAIDALDVARLPVACVPAVDAALEDLARAVRDALASLRD